MLNHVSTYANTFRKNHNIGGVCMAGSIWTLKDRWVVGWYWQGKQWKISRYKGEILYRTHLQKEKCRGYKNAQKCLALIQSRYEEYLKGNCAFRIEEFTGKGWTDVIEFYEEWQKYDTLILLHERTLYVSLSSYL